MELTQSSVRLRAEDRGILEDIAKSGIVDAFRMQLLGERLIVDRYLDTDDWALMGQGCTYREREFARRRWVSFCGAAHDVGPPPEPLEAQLPEGVRLEDIQELLPPTLRAWAMADYRLFHEVLRVENNRMLFELVQDSEPMFLMCLDDAEFAAGGVQRRFCEVKINARRTPSEALAWLCETLTREFGLMPHSCSKLEQGIALTGVQPREADGAAQRPALPTISRSTSVP